MTPRAPSRHVYAHSLLASLILSLIHPIIASSAPPTLSMDTPPPIAQCAAGTFTWQGGRPPYTLSVRSTDTDTPITVFSNSGLTDTVFHWVAAVAAGTDLVVELTDTGVSGAGGGRLEDNFVVEEGSDACLSNGGPSSSSLSSTTSEQATGSDTSPPTSTSQEQPTTSAVTPTSSSPDSTAPATTDTDTDTPPTGSPSSSDGAPSQTLTGSAAGTTDSGRNTSSGGPATPGGSSIGLTTTSTSTSSSGRSTDTSTGTSSSGRAGAGTMIAGAAIGSLVAGFVLAAGLFCVWKARRARRGTTQRGRQRRGRLEPYEYPSAGPVHTHPAVSTTTPPPPDTEDGNVLASGRGPHHHHRHLNAGPVVHERQGPGKDRWDGSVLPSTMQPTTSQRVDLTILHGAERSRVMDAVDGAEGSRGQVRRRWDLRDLDPDVEDAFPFDLADYSEYSASTAPPPYSQIA